MSEPVMDVERKRMRECPCCFSTEHVEEWGHCCNRYKCSSCDCIFPGGATENHYGIIAERDKHDMENLQRLKTLHREIGLLKTELQRLGVI